MGYIEGFEFIIYRLKEERQDSEFLLFNTNNRSFDQYNQKRLSEILAKEIGWDNILQVILKIHKAETEQEKTFYTKSKEKIFNTWIEEEYILINNIGYLPQDEDLFKEEEKILFNTYNKTRVLKEYSEDYAGDFKSIDSLIKNLVNNDEKSLNYVYNWLAWIIQNPLDRLPTAIIFQGIQGSGKTKLCDYVLKKIFGSNFIIPNQTNLDSDYNDYMMGKQIIGANEVIQFENKYEISDKLKTYVTDDYITLNRKFKNTLQMKNYSQWIFFTNNMVPMKIEKWDRRYSVFRTENLISREVIGNLIKNNEKEIKSFIYYLMSLKPTFEEVCQPLHTKAKEEIQNINNSSIEDFVEDIFNMEDLQKGLSSYIDEIFPNSICKDNYFFIREHESINCLLIKINDLYILYKKYCENGNFKVQSIKKFSRDLRAIGFKIITARDNLDKTNKCLILKEKGVLNV